MTTFGVDISHYQGQVNFDLLVADGSVEFCGMKAWEDGQADYTFETNRSQCRRVGLPCFGYVYMHASDTDDQIQRCFQTLADTVIALDWEAPDCGSNTVERWMDAYERHAQRQGLAYYGLYPPQPATSRMSLWPRWFPEYTDPTNLKLPPWLGQPNPDWRNYYAIWQFSDKVIVDGISGPCDGNQLSPAISIDAFKHWLDTGNFPPIPPLPEIPILPPAEMQLALLLQGYSVGPSGVDGIWGPDSADALARYYTDNPG